MSELRISLFGKFRVQYGQQTLTGFEARKVQELFCYLLLYRDRPHPREALADLLWGEKDIGQPNRNLRKILWQLRVALDAQTESLSDQMLLVEADWIQINPKIDMWLDVAEFEQISDRFQDVAGRELDSRGFESLQSAAALYRGGLQESWYEDWYLYERERFQYMYLSMLDKLMSYCEMCHNHEAGLALGNIILRYEKARERTHRGLMRLYYLTGDRTAALRQYERCVAVLNEELGVGPAERTIALYEQIRSDQLYDLIPAPAETITGSKVPASPLPRVLDRLRQLQSILTKVQHQIHQDVRAIEQVVNR